MLTRASISLSILLLIGNCFAQGKPVAIEPGELTGTLKAFPQGNPDYYAMQGCYHVPAGDTLLIERRATIVFTGWCRWIVNGVILAGTDTTKGSVTFRSEPVDGRYPNREIWLDHSTGTSIFSGCDWSDGRAGMELSLPFESADPCSIATFDGSAIKSVNSSLRIHGSYFRGTANSLVVDSASQLVMTGSTFYDCQLDWTGATRRSQLFVGNGSVADISSSNWHQSKGTLEIVRADSVMVTQCNFLDNAEFGVSVSGSAHVLFKSCSFLENGCWRGGLLWCDRGSDVKFEYCKLYRNLASTSKSLFTIRPGAALSISQCTLEANRAGDQVSLDQFSSEVLPLVANYGLFDAYRTIFSDSKPNIAVQTGQPSLVRERVSVMTCGDSLSRTFYEEPLDTILASDTARAKFVHCCIFNFGAPLFRVSDSFDFPQDFPKLTITETATTRLIEKDPLFENGALGDLRLQAASPCIGPFDAGAVGSNRPTRWIIGCGDTMSPSDQFRQQ